MFGENSNCKILDVKDGTSNTFMLGEQTVTTANGESNPWGYRGWVMTGVDPNGGINLWVVTAGVAQIGNLTSWGQAGSQHTGGCYFDTPAELLHLRRNQPKPGLNQHERDLQI
jgi:hypothetical protein